jgi:Family of unknown function (DUF6069)
MTTAPIPEDPPPDPQQRAGYPQPGIDQPDYGQPGYGQPGYGQGGYHDQRSPRRTPSSHPHVEAGRLWAGGVATAIVAGLIALIGVLASRWLFNIPLLAPKRQGTYGDVHTTDLVLLAAAAALVATGLAYLLLLSTPRPLAFLDWIIGLATVLAVVLAFSTGAPLNQRVATSIVYVILGLAIGSLVSGVAARSVRRSEFDGYPAHLESAGPAGLSAWIGLRPAGSPVPHI